jgi:hypothetical protein
VQKTLAQQQKRVIIVLLQFSSATQTVRTMQKLTLTQAQNALALHANNNTLTVAQLQQLLQNVSVTFAQILYVTNVTLAAAHKAQVIQKVTSANVLLASNIAAQTQLYARAVRKNAAQYAQNDVAAIQQFVASSNYFEHTATHCIVAHKQHAHKLYLFAIYNNATSLLLHNNAVVSKQHVAQYCTASAAAQLLQTDNTVHNVTNNIVHSVQVRTIALSNIVSIRARKQLLSV